MFRWFKKNKPEPHSSAQESEPNPMLPQLSQQTPRSGTASTPEQQELLIQQLKQLNDLGIRLNSGITIDMLLEEYEGVEAEHWTLSNLLEVLGGDREIKGTWMPYSPHVLNMDTEAIEDEDAYTSIMERMLVLAGEDLPLTHITSRVEWEDESAWIAFQLHGKPYKWTLEVNNDWMDLWLLDYLIELNEEQGAGRKLAYYILDQNVVMVYQPPERLALLQEQCPQEWIS